MADSIQHHAEVAINRRGQLQRRDFLKAISYSSIAAGTLSWPDMVSLQAAELRKRGMACILLWMQGGPSQFETFSPLPNHANGGETKAIKTNVSGIQISENLPHLAKKMDEIAIIRSMTSKEGAHPRASYLMHTGYLPTASVKYPTLGSMVCERIEDDQCELPSFVRIGRRFRNAGGGGLLGVDYDPFLMTNATSLPANAKPTTSTDRYRRRLKLMESLEEDYATKGAKEEVRDHRKLYQKTAKMILSPQMKAFDLKQESDKMRKSYGEGQFAEGCLLARRLIESGVTFVEVGCGNWDTHKDNFTRSKELCGRFDQPYARLLSDLKERGMLDRTMIIWMGEFGRTPKINARTGRDHYPRAFSVALSGGLVKGGQVIGKLNDSGTTVAERPVKVPDLFSSIFHGLKIEPSHENVSPIGRPIKLVEEGKVVKELFS